MPPEVGLGLSLGLGSQFLGLHWPYDEAYPHKVNKIGLGHTGKDNWTKFESPFFLQSYTIQFIILQYLIEEVLAYI